MNNKEKIPENVPGNPSEQRDKETLERIVAEAVDAIPGLPVDDEVTYLGSSSGLLRLGKDENGVYITGQNSDYLTEQAEKIIEKLRTEFPEENFRLF